MERELGVSIDVRNIDERDIETKSDVQFRMKENNNNIVFSFDKKLIGEGIDFYLDEKYVFGATVGKRGEIRLNKDSESATLLIDGLDGKAVLSARV